MKSRGKSVNAAAIKAQNKTGGGPPIPEVSVEDVQIMKFIGPVAVQGVGVSESFVSKFSNR